MHTGGNINLSDDAIMALHNDLVDGSGQHQDIIHACRVALGERCVETPSGDHYPSPGARNRAHVALIAFWRQRYGSAWPG